MLINKPCGLAGYCIIGNHFIIQNDVLAAIIYGQKCFFFILFCFHLQIVDYHKYRLIFVIFCWCIIISNLNQNSYCIIVKPHIN